MTQMPQVKPFDVNTIPEDRAEKLATALGIDMLAAERHKTHGDFRVNADISQALKQLFRDCAGWDNLTVVEREAMDMIALKFSRILSGKSHERQHWEDVVGYAKLALERCP